MSISPEIATNGNTAGPGLPAANGLPAGSAVNQSPTTAQNHHAQDAYPVSTNYASYFSAPQHSNVNTLTPAYFPPESQRQEVVRHEQTPYERIQPPIQSHGEHEYAEDSQDPDNDELQYDDSPVDPSPAPSLLLASSKRKKNVSNSSGDELAPTPKKRKPRMSAAQGENGEMKDEPDVGPAGGAKHWTDEEKSRLFNWMLNDDDRWDQFGSKMNTIFREGSKTLFNSRKTFTALKSCYHRNLDVFKQIYAFEAFLVRAPTQSPHAIGGGGPGSPSSSSSASVMHEPADIANAPIPPAFTSAAHRQNFLEKKLEAARAMNVPVGNLTLKVVDHWHEMGWYTTFKKRFKEDPKTGLPVARHDHSETSSTISSMLAPVKQRPAVPTVRMEEEAEDESEEEDAEHVEEHLGPHSPLTHRMGNGDSASADIQHRRHAESLIPAPYQSPQPVMSRASRPQHQPSPSITQQSHVNAHTQAPSAGGYHPHNPHSPYPSPQMPHVPTYPYPSHAPTPYYHPSMDYQNPQQLIHFQSQAAQSLSHLTALTQTLIVTCNSLTELVRLQTEDSKVQTEMLRRREEREEALARKAVAVREGGENRSQDAPESLGLAQKVSLAKDVLANDDLKDEEVKRAASDYLQRVFYSKSSK